MTEPPEITSIGPPPDKHAIRIVGEMIQWLHAERDRISSQAIGSLNVSAMGTIKGQHKVVDRLRKLTEGLALEITLRPAKRGRFSLTVATWVVWDTKQCVPVDYDKPVPKHSCLAIKLNIYTGANHVPVSKTAIPLVVTRHSLERLAQRAGVRTVRDMIEAMRELWIGTNVLTCSFLDRDTWLTPPYGGWAVPITLSNGALAVATLDRDQDGARRLVATTILDPDMAEKSPGTKGTVMAIRRDKAQREASGEAEAQTPASPEAQTE